MCSCDAKDVEDVIFTISYIAFDVIFSAMYISSSFFFFFFPNPPTRRNFTAVTVANRQDIKTEEQPFPVGVSHTEEDTHSHTHLQNSQKETLS